MQTRLVGEKSAGFLYARRRAAMILTGKSKMMYCELKRGALKYSRDLCKTSFSEQEDIDFCFHFDIIA